MTGSPPLSLLIVDDEERYRQVLCREFTRRHHDVRDVPSAEKGLEALSERGADVVLLDLRMAGKGGIGFLEEARRRGVDSEIVILTGYPSVETAVQALRHGAYDYLSKPVDLDQLERVVERAGEHRALRRENGALRRALTPAAATALTSKSPSMQQILARLPRIAAADSTVLLEGETGTGKEVIAREIHRLGRRSSEPLVVVDCAALQSSVRSSELFGHERGAFTGAECARPGLFEAAHKGTVFLDEVGELDPESQAALLRVLESSEIRRVGSSQSRAIDVRVLAATHRDLAAEVRDGRFRSDLLYRLQVLPIALPPLRERREDILDLFFGFLARLGGDRDRPRLSPEAEAALLHYGWPGNIRELRNVAEMVAVTGERDVLTVEDLLPRLGRSEPAPEVSNGAIPPLREVEREHILRVYAATGNNKKRAAELLGISLRTLYNKLAEYDSSPRQQPPPGEGAPPLPDPES